MSTLIAGCALFGILFAVNNIFAFRAGNAARD